MIVCCSYYFHCVNISLPKFFFYNTQEKRDNNSDLQVKVLVTLSNTSAHNTHPQHQTNVAFTVENIICILVILDMSIGILLRVMKYLNRTMNYDNYI